MIATLIVRDGQEVAASAELATVRAEEDGAAAQSPPALVEIAIIRQDASLAAQSDAALAAANAQDTQLAAQRSGLVAKIQQLQSQIATQRALIARALYRQPKILIMDEGTAHLDTAHEQAVNAAMGITRIIIAHRQETIAQAGRVLVMSGGGLHDRMVLTAQQKLTQIQQSSSQEGTTS